MTALNRVMMRLAGHWYALPEPDDPFWGKTAEPMDGELERMWEHDARSYLTDYHSQREEVLSFIEGIKQGQRISVLLSIRKLQTVTKCERCARYVMYGDLRQFISVVTIRPVSLCRRCVRLVGAMSPHEANLMAREVVQRVANAQAGTPDEHDDLTISGDQLEEIVFEVIKDWIWEGELNEAGGCGLAVDTGECGG